MLPDERIKAGPNMSTNNLNSMLVGKGRQDLARQETLGVGNSKPTNRWQCRRMKRLPDERIKAGPNMSTNTSDGVLVGKKERRYCPNCQIVILNNRVIKTLCERPVELLQYGFTNNLRACEVGRKDFWVYSHLITVCKHPWENDLLKLLL